MEHFLKEKLEILSGTRGHGTKAQAAVRREELAPLLRLPHQLKSRLIDGVPTQQDYNALRGDVKMIFDMLVELGTIQQGKINGQKFSQIKLY